MKDYVVLDLENPNFRQNSICAIGTILVRDNNAVDKKYSLINPEDNFDPINIQITGIDASCVIDAPTLPEYWQEIESWLTNNIILGHNITYDLRVISKSLLRYHLDIPDFRYACTLALGRKYLNLNSYKLENIAKSLNIHYNPHNAIEDARASYEVYEYINRHNNLDNEKIKNFKYQPKTKEKIDPVLSRNINNLHGILLIIRYNDNITPSQSRLLEDWLNENMVHNQYKLFHNINQKLRTFIEMHSIESLEYLVENLKPIEKSNIYNQTTLKTQVLQGIIEAITLDDKANINEIEYLNQWLYDNRSLKEVYPYRRIQNIVNDALEKGYLAPEDEKYVSSQLKQTITQKRTCKDKIETENKTCCITGDFKHGRREIIERYLVSLGFTMKTCVSKKIDYLFVGDLGSPSWKYGKMGGKIIKAQELQDKGENIKIISESELFRQMGDDFEFFKLVEGGY